MIKKKKFDIYNYVYSVYVGIKLSDTNNQYMEC